MSTINLQECAYGRLEKNKRNDRPNKGVTNVLAEKLCDAMAEYHKRCLFFTPLRHSSDGFSTAWACRRHAGFGTRPSDRRSAILVKRTISVLQRGFITLRQEGFCVLRPHRRSSLPPSPPRAYCQRRAGEESKGVSRFIAILSPPQVRIPAKLLSWQKWFSQTNPNRLDSLSTLNWVSTVSRTVKGSVPTSFVLNMSSCYAFSCTRNESTLCSKQMLAQQ